MKTSSILALLLAVTAFLFSNETLAHNKLATWAEQKCTFAIEMRSSSNRLLSSNHSILCLVDAVNGAGSSEESSGCIATLLGNSEPAYRPPVPTELLTSADDVIAKGRCTSASVVDLLFSRPIYQAGGLPLLEAFKYTSAARHNRKTQIIVDKIGATNVVTRLAASLGTIL
ncbi:hypothetical protein ACNQKP_10640 [Bdellovibrio bacteriovorus]|uniref:hypothetical protein n=1 Tax=Bdellovibrio bacteriovorus TaxID=959 RepID=UPI003AA870D9